MINPGFIGLVNGWAAALNAELTAIRELIGAGGGGGAIAELTYANAAPNTVFRVAQVGDGYTRPSTRTDISFMFVGTATPPNVVSPATNGRYANDIWVQPRPTA